MEKWRDGGEGGRERVGWRRGRERGRNGEEGGREVGMEKREGERGREREVGMEEREGEREGGREREGKYTQLKFQANVTFQLKIN